MSSKILADLYASPGRPPTLPDVERRSFAGEVRLATREDGKPIIQGYAAVYGSLSEDLGGFRERVQPGCFRGCLEKGADVRAFFNHETSAILGRRSAGTLRIFDEKTGLRYEIDPPDTSVGRDLVESIRRGDIRESSFGFKVAFDQWSRDASTTPPLLTRDLVRADIFDISPVTFPAYRDTTVALRSLEQARGQLETTAHGFSLSSYLDWLHAINASS